MSINKSSDGWLVDIQPGGRGGKRFRKTLPTKADPEYVRRYFAFGAPNDEALGGHPLSRVGLRHYAVHEVYGSVLVRELERRNSVHPRHDRALYLASRHFVFTFQDNTMECVVPEEKWWTPTVSVHVQLEEAEVAWRATRPAARRTSLEN